MLVTIRNWTYRHSFNTEPLSDTICLQLLYSSCVLKPFCLQGLFFREMVWQGQKWTCAGTSSSVVGRLWQISCTVPWVQEYRWLCLRLLWLPCRGLKYVSELAEISFSILIGMYYSQFKHKAAEMRRGGRTCLQLRSEPRTEFTLFFPERYKSPEAPVVLWDVWVPRLLKIQAVSLFTFLTPLLLMATALHSYTWGQYTV